MSGRTIGMQMKDRYFDIWGIVSRIAESTVPILDEADVLVIGGWVSCVAAAIVALDAQAHLSI